MVSNPRGDNPRAIMHSVKAEQGQQDALRVAVAVKAITGTFGISLVRDACEGQNHLLSEQRRRNRLREPALGDISSGCCPNTTAMLRPSEDGEPCRFIFGAGSTTKLAGLNPGHVLEANWDATLPLPCVTPLATSRPTGPQLHSAAHLSGCFHKGVVVVVEEEAQRDSPAACTQAGSRAPKS